MEIVLAGFLLGLMGSFHCAGMCGPIALSLPLRGKSFGERFISGTLYNLGRTIMYGVMGAIFGFIGQGLFLLGIQRWVSIGMGILLIVSVVIPLVFKKIQIKQFNTFIGWVRQRIQKLFMVRSYKGLFLIGMLNSLLPCGLVYMAIIGAIAVGNVFYGSLYLILFGLGTLPMMLAISLVGNALTLNVRNLLNKLVPYVVVLIGVIFVFRGLCLGIPYLSPSKEKLEMSILKKPSDTCQKDMKIEGGCCHHK
jgi:sulfite exporter TauE/SafE